MRDRQRAHLCHAGGGLDAVKSRNRTILWHTNPPVAEIGDQLISLVIGGADPGRDAGLAGFPQDVFGHRIVGQERSMFVVGVDGPLRTKLETMLKNTLGI